MQKTRLIHEEEEEESDEEEGRKTIAMMVESMARYVAHTCTYMYMYTLCVCV